MRLAYDSITASDIPQSAEIVCGYVDGAYQWSDSDWARFPNAQHVGIAVSAGFNGGQVLDVETGDATADQAPGWVRMRRAAGQDPTIYTNYSAWWGVRQAFINAGIAEPHYWIALWDDSPVLLSGAVAKQYIDPPLSGGHYDLSVVADFWPGVDGVLGPGGGQITGEQVTQDEFNALVAGSPLANLAGGITSTYQELLTMKAELDAIKAALPTSPGTEPAEPKTVTGTFTGTLS